MATERRTRSWWASTVVRWRGSGLNARDFAAREGVSARTLTWWSSTLRRGTRASRGSMELAIVAPIEIEVPRRAGASSRSMHVEIMTGDVVVRVEVGTDVEYVGALVSALGVRS